MINPQDFIKPKKEEVVVEGMQVSGTFVCQECLGSVSVAVLDEDERKLIYTCIDGHVNEAKL